MKNEFIKSLQMIKILKIKNQEQYKKLVKDFLILSLDSLKYISQKSDFKEIVKMANEIWNSQLIILLFDTNFNEEGGS